MIGMRRAGDPLHTKMATLINDQRFATAKELYGILNVLDTKATSLLQFNALMAVIIVYLLDKGGGATRGFVIGSCLIILSTAVSLIVVGIFWPFLARDIDAELTGLARVVDMRTRCYQVAWLMASAGVILLVVSIGIRYG